MNYRYTTSTEVFLSGAHRAPDSFLYFHLRSGAGLPPRQTTRFFGRSKIRTRPAEKNLSMPPLDLKRLMVVRVFWIFLLWHNVRHSNLYDKLPLFLWLPGCGAFSHDIVVAIGYFCTRTWRPDATGRSTNRSSSRSTGGRTAAARHIPCAGQPATTDYFPRPGTETDLSFR